MPPPHGLRRRALAQQRRSPTVPGWGEGHVYGYKWVRVYSHREGALSLSLWDAGRDRVTFGRRTFSSCAVAFSAAATAPSPVEPALPLAFRAAPAAAAAAAPACCRAAAPPSGTLPPLTAALLCIPSPTASPVALTAAATAAAGGANSPLRSGPPLAATYGVCSLTGSRSGSLSNHCTHGAGRGVFARQRSAIRLAPVTHDLLIRDLVGSDSPKSVPCFWGPSAAHRWRPRATATNTVVHVVRFMTASRRQGMRCARRVPWLSRPDNHLTS